MNLMIIANPIYDTVFKKLMENERLAKFFIGTLLEQTVVSLEMNPQEYTVDVDPEARTRETLKPSVLTMLGFSIVRMDFVATIRTESGERKKILIEVQKAWEAGDLTRFRTYLAEQYRKKDTVDGAGTVLPITTIYVLYFNLPEIQSACIKVERGYYDMISRQPVKARSPFIEKLTHDSYVIQTKRITSDRCQTKLDQLLSVFEQAGFVDRDELTKQYSRNPDDETIKEMVELLHFVGTDPGERKQLEKEQEAVRIWHAALDKTFREMEKQAIELEEQAKVIAEQENVIAEQENVIAALKKQLEEMNTGHTAGETKPSLNDGMEAGQPSQN